MTIDNLDPETGLFLVKGIRATDTDGRRARREVHHGQATRLRRGVLTTAERWAGLDAGQKYRDSIRAVVETRRIRPVVSHQSAAALWGIPLGSPWPRAVHLLAEPASHARSKNGVLVHRGEFDWDEVDEVDGILVTTPARTLLDLARTARFADAVVALDHALNPDRADSRVLVTPTNCRRRSTRPDRRVGWSGRGERWTSPARTQPTRVSPSAGSRSSSWASPTPSFRYGTRIPAEAGTTPTTSGWTSP
jgi:predicted transcriptional regulator of viral defense system